ncbi:hypothetical protein L6R50_08720 [Myxococcota bacterium]|nr:hypothetical protein [Myxococcota bacterium]
MSTPDAPPIQERFVTGGSLETDRIDGLIEDYRQMVHRLRGCLNGVVLNAALLKRLPPGAPRADECERVVKEQLARAASVLDDFERYLQVGISAPERLPAGAIHTRVRRAIAHPERVAVESDEDLPAIDVDYQAVTEALRTVIEKALAWTGPDAPANLRVSADGEGVSWTVTTPGAHPPHPGENPFQLYQGRDEEDRFDSRLGRARRIVRLHGGRLEVQGTVPLRFMMWLPSAEETP